MQYAQNMQSYFSMCARNKKGLGYNQVYLITTYGQLIVVVSGVDQWGRFLQTASNLACKEKSFITNTWSSIYKETNWLCISTSLALSEQ